MQIKLVPYVPLEITFRNKVPTGNILAGTLFLKVISRETQLNHILRLSCWKERLPVEIRAIT
jgi:hypothetical protein